MSARVKKTITVAVVALLAVAGGVRAYAQGGPEGHGRPGFGGRGFGRGAFGLELRGLDLTDEQRTQVKAIFEQHRSELQAVGQRLGAAFKAQHDAVTAIPVEESVIRAKSAELAAVQADAAILHAKIHSEVFQLLTPEQQQKAQQLKTEREQRRQQMQQRWQQRQQQRPQAQ